MSTSESSASSGSKNNSGSGKGSWRGSIDNSEAVAAKVILPNNDSDSIDVGEKEVSAWQDLIAGGISGSMSVIVGHPFDTLKVRMQTSSGPLAWGGLFRGMLPPLSTATLINAIIFSTYGISSRLYDTHLGQDTSDASDFKKSMTCGSIAGAVQCLVVCPVELVKCRLQIRATKAAATTSSNTSGSVIKVVNDIIESYNGSWRGLYRGMTVTCYREIPAFGLYFSSYDYVKDTLLSKTDLLSNGAAAAMAGGFAGSFTWLIVYPFDVLKTQIQINSTIPMRMIPTAQQLYKRHGWKFFFRGLNVTLLRAIPVNGVVFPVYEYTLSHLQE